MFNRRIASENHLAPVISFMQLLVKSVHHSKHITLLRNEITTEVGGTTLQAVLPYTYKFHNQGEETGEVGKGFVAAQIYLNHGLVHLSMTDVQGKGYAQESIPINNTPKMSSWIQSTLQSLDEDGGMS